MTTLPWPTHPDGSNKTVGEMNPEERIQVLDAAQRRYRATMGENIIKRRIADALESIVEKEEQARADAREAEYELRKSAEAR